MNLPTNSGRCTTTAKGGGGLNFMHHPALYYNFFYWRHPFLPCSIRPFPNISMLFSSSPEKLIMVPCNSLQKIFNGWGLKQILMLKTTSIDNFPTSILPSARLSILTSVCVTMILLFFFSRIYLINRICIPNISLLAKVNDE